MRLKLILLTLLYVSTSACLDGHDNSKSSLTIGGNDSNAGLEVKTAVASDQLKVKLTGDAKLMLFEVNAKLLFSRLVYTRNNQTCVTSASSGREITVAGGAIKEPKCYTDAKEIAFIKACVELEKQASGQGSDKYKLSIYSNKQNHKIAIRCKALGATDNTYDAGDIYASWLADDKKLPTGYKFDAQKITATNIQAVIDRASLCINHAKLELHNSHGKYYCTCNPEDSYGAAESKVVAMFGDEPQCREGNKAHLLTTLAKIGTPQ